MWENARHRDKASRSRFAQHTLHPEVVAAELERVRAAIGGSEDVERFFTAVLHTANVPARMNGRIEIRVSHETPRTLRQAIGREEPFAGRFDLPLAEGEIHLGRTSPVVEGVASWTLDPSVDGSKPAISGHRKSGHFRRPETAREFYFIGSRRRKDLGLLKVGPQGP